MKIKKGSIFYWQSQNDARLPDEIILIIGKHHYLNKFWFYAYESVWGTKYSLLHEIFIKTMKYIGELE